jgi:hypothetical protein
MDRSAQIRLSIAFDVAAGGFVVRLSSPPADWAWLLLEDDRSAPPRSDEVCSETFIPLETYERDAAAEYVDRLFKMHLKCLGYR